MVINEVTGAVVDGAMKVHSVLGPGLLESAYQACLAYELRKRGLEVITQFELPVIYDEIKIDLGYRVDLLVEGSVVVELKTVSKICTSPRSAAVVVPQVGQLPSGTADQLPRSASKGRNQTHGQLNDVSIPVSVTSVLLCGSTNALGGSTRARTGAGGNPRNFGYILQPH